MAEARPLGPSQCIVSEQYRQSAAAAFRCCGEKRTRGRAHGPRQEKHARALRAGPGHGAESRIHRVGGSHSLLLGSNTGREGQGCNPEAAAADPGRRAGKGSVRGKSAEAAIAARYTEGMRPLLLLALAAVLPLCAADAAFERAEKKLDHIESGHALPGS